jgi:hypothetical protein
VDEPREYPVPVASDEDVAAFIARYGTPYDPETDDYHRDPFVADIREGKNDPIYNAHAYHTKVPPRAIIPYILHYTEPGDIILDPFCGSGMTGVAALMCEEPPEDILQAVPGAKKGARRTILNDLSPAACHIAYNYCTPVDVEALRAEIERIKAAVKEEFDWLYGTEHYEPAVGLYDPTNPDVACRLKNPPPGMPQTGLLAIVERNWDLLDRAEVERRMGSEALSNKPLPEGANKFVCIPATIQYTIWSDVYKCQGMVTIEEPTGRTSTRGKGVGQPILRKRRVPRGCGGEIVLWKVAVDEASGEVHSLFRCPACQTEWKKDQLPRIYDRPILSCYEYVGFRRPDRLVSLRGTRFTTALESERLVEILSKLVPYWYPDVDLDRNGPQYRRNALSVRKVFKVSDFYTRRNLWSQARLWNEFNSSKHQKGLRFLFTALTNGMTRRSAYVPGESPRAKPMMKGSLYIPSFSVEWNPLPALAVRLRLSGSAFVDWNPDYEDCRVLLGTAARLPVPTGSVDYVFTDPPFGSNIYYSEVSVLWESWLGILMDREEEAVVHRKNDGGTKRLPDYEAIMTRCFCEIARVLKPERWATIEFNNSDGTVFEAVKRAVRNAGLTIENMVFLDKVQKTFKQLKGEKGEEDVVGHDVIFNLRKPAEVRASRSKPLGDRRNHHNPSLEDLVAKTVREHLRSLPQSIEKAPKTYSDEHRTTPFLNTMLMNTLIPRSVDVSRLNLPFIDRVCGRYFRRVDGRWYLRDEAVGDEQPKGNHGRLFQLPDESVTIEDEKSAIAWLRQTLRNSHGISSRSRSLILARERLYSSIWEGSCRTRSSWPS